MKLSTRMRTWRKMSNVRHNRFLRPVWMKSVTHHMPARSHTHRNWSDILLNDGWWCTAEYKWANMKQPSYSLGRTCQHWERGKASSRWHHNCDLERRSTKGPLALKSSKICPVFFPFRLILAMCLWSHKHIASMSTKMKNTGRKLLGGRGHGGGCQRSTSTGSFVQSEWRVRLITCSNESYAYKQIGFTTVASVASAEYERANIKHRRCIF